MKLLHFERQEPQVAAMNPGAYDFMVPDAPLSYDDRQKIFNQAHPSAQEYVILTESGLRDGEDRKAVVNSVLANTLGDAVYSGLNGTPLLRSGRLLNPADKTTHRFNGFFYATTRTHWLELGLMGDDNPIKHAVIKGGLGRAAFVAFDRSQLAAYRDNKLVTPEANTVWGPLPGHTTESVVKAVFHIISAQSLSEHLSTNAS